MKKNGFTLVEVVMVIVLIGIAGLVSILAINNYMQRSYDEQLKIIRNTIASAATNYRVSHNMAFYQKMNISELNSSETYLDPISYRKGVVCPIDSTSGTIELRGQTGYELDRKNESYCIKFFCNGEVIIDDYSDPFDPNYCDESESPRN